MIFVIFPRPDTVSIIFMPFVTEKRFSVIICPLSLGQPRNTRPARIPIIIFVKELTTLCCSNNEFPRCVEANGSSSCNVSLLSVGVPTSARFVCLLVVPTALKSARLFSSAIQKFDGWYGMRIRRLKPTGNIAVDLEFT